MNDRLQVLQQLSPEEWVMWYSLYRELPPVRDPETRAKAILIIDRMASDSAARVRQKASAA